MIDLFSLIAISFYDPTTTRKLSINLLYDNDSLYSRYICLILLVEKRRINLTIYEKKATKLSNNPILL